MLAMGSKTFCASQGPVISKVGLSYSHGKFYDVQKSSLNEYTSARQNHVSLNYLLAFKGRWNAEIACQWGALSAFPVAYERTHSSTLIGLKVIGQYEFIGHRLADNVGLQPYILTGYSFNSYPNFKKDLLRFHRSASVIQGLGFDWTFLEHTSLVGIIAYSFPLSESYRASMNFEMGVRYALHLADQRALKSELILANIAKIHATDTIVMQVRDTIFLNRSSELKSHDKSIEQINLEQALDSLARMNIEKSRSASELERRSWAVSGIYNMLDDEGIPFQTSDIQSVFCLAPRQRMAELKDKMERWDKQGVLLFYQYNILLDESRLLYFHRKQDSIELLERILSSFPEAQLIDLDE
jgi:hypothetical protein